MSPFSPAMHRFGDVSVRLSVELGRADMALRDVLQIGEGSVVALNRLTDELLDVTANGKVIARGEVVAQDGRFALRIVSLAGDEGAEVEPKRPASAMSEFNAVQDAPAQVPSHIPSPAEPTPDQTGAPNAQPSASPGEVEAP